MAVSPFNQLKKKFDSSALYVNKVILDKDYIEFQEL